MTGSGALLFATAEQRQAPQSEIAVNVAQPSIQCEGLKLLSVPGATVVAANVVPEGPTPDVVADSGTGTPAPDVRGRMFAFQRDSLAAQHCRVTAILRPSVDSEIGIEVWLPVSRWNGKFQMVGNGGWGGDFSYGPMRAALNAGYAAASTDTGHKGDGAQFALGHPENARFKRVSEVVQDVLCLFAGITGKCKGRFRKMME